MFSESNPSSRIPLGLQAVFLASNRGKDVTKPPPEKAANKTFTRNWMFQGLGRGTRTRRTKGSRNKSERGLTKLAQFGRSSTSKSDASNTSIGSMNNEEPVAKVHSKPITTFVQKPNPKPKTTNGRPPMSPQAYLDVMIHARGYSTRRYRTLQTGYYCKPTKYQQASYHVNIVKHVRNHRVEEFRSILSSGISPNPCNAYGESLLHMVCRRGDADLLEIMLENGSSVQVADDYGRTPLHDACWAATPSFDTVEQIASRDITLFHMTDSRGAVPLSYVRREHWSEWIDFLERKKDTWWPPITGEDEPSELVDVAPNERPIPEPANALTIELAGMVASGVMSPSEARYLQDQDMEDMDATSSDEESDDDSSEDDSDDDDESSSVDEEEEFEALGMTRADMDDILKRMKYSNAQQVQ